MAYDLPTPTLLKQRYPAFASVDDGTIQYWLTDAERFADTSWIEADYAPALIAVAAHNMLKAGVAGIANSDTTSMAAAGLTDFQSGGFRVRFSDDAVKAAQAGGFASTTYGQEYAALLRKNKGGPRVTPMEPVACCAPYDLRNGTYYFP